MMVSGAICSLVGNNLRYIVPLNFQARRNGSCFRRRRRCWQPGGSDCQDQGMQGHWVRRRRRQGSVH
jgi:hypothetical protein